MLTVELAKSLNNWPLRTTSPSMAGSLSEIKAVAAENNENRPSEDTFRPPNEIALAAKGLGHSFVSKVRPAEEYNPTHQPSVLGDS